MPTNQNAYNSRVTDEALEKRFRDTFRSQGGAELVDDLYASGVIVPVVDFTSAAEGSQLGENLQTAWDFSTNHDNVANTTTTIINTAGFWRCDLTYTDNGAATGGFGIVRIDDGTSTKVIWQIGGIDAREFITDGSFVVFLRSGDSLEVSSGADCFVNIWYRQIATVSGDLVNPSGFTSS